MKDKTRKWITRGLWGFSIIIAGLIVDLKNSKYENKILRKSFVEGPTFFKELDMDFKDEQFKSYNQLDILKESTDHINFLIQFGLIHNSLEEALEGELDPIKKEIYLELDNILDCDDYVVETIKTYKKIIEANNLEKSLEDSIRGCRGYCTLPNKKRTLHRWLEVKYQGEWKIYETTVPNNNLNVEGIIYECIERINLEGERIK